MFTWLSKHCQLNCSNQGKVDMQKLKKVTTQKTRKFEKASKGERPIKLFLNEMTNIVD